MVDSIADTETMRDELIRTVYGVWDFVKNGGVCDAANWEIEWIGFLPGKRESRRYVGDYLLNQNDVRAEGKFEDLIAYGGWTMDDHHPAGFLTTEPPTIWHPAPSPYGIPYRCLDSKNIENLMFAGRNISATHTALSSTRVMATCALMGQALGTAAAIALRDGLTPRGGCLRSENASARFRRIRRRRTFLLGNEQLSASCACSFGPNGSRTSVCSAGDMGLRRRSSLCS